MTLVEMNVFLMFAPKNIQQASLPQINFEVFIIYFIYVSL